MKVVKMIVGTLAVGLVTLVTPALAGPSCSSVDVFCAAAPPIGIPGSPFMFFSGLVEIGPKPTVANPGLYLVLDGAAHDMDPLDGYVGFNAADILKSTSVLGLIGSRNGDFARDGSNDLPISSLLDLSGPPRFAGAAPNLDLRALGLPAPGSALPGLGQK